MGPRHYRWLPERAMTAARHRNARHTGSMADGRNRVDDETYLRRVEELAGRVCEAALTEGWLMYLPDDSDQTPLQKAINELARNIRHVHYDGDGCMDDDHSGSA